MSEEEDKTPLEAAIDLFVYAPLGLALSARELLPGLVKRGRQQVANQTQMARFVGQMAMQMGQKEAEKLLKDGAEQAGGLLSSLGVRPAPDRSAATAATSAPSGPPRSAPAPNAAKAGPAPDAAAPVVDAPSTAKPAAATVPAPPGGGPAPDAAAPAIARMAKPADKVPSSNGTAASSPPKPKAGELAIPGYDALSASQVVQRLAGLTPSELDAVRAYEGATRQRKTILNKVSQLQAP